MVAGTRFIPLHVLAVLLGAVEIFLFAGVIFGWSSVVYIYKDVGYFSDLCPANDINTTSNRIRTTTTDTATSPSNWDPITTTTAVSDINTSSAIYTSTKSGWPGHNGSALEWEANREVDEVTTTCDPQDEQFNLIFTLSSVIAGAMALPQGILFDRLGTRASRIVCMLTLLLAFLCLIFATPSIPYLLYPGYIALACGGYHLLLTNMQLSSLLPSLKSTVVTLFTGSYGSSSSIFLSFKAAYEEGMSIQTSFTVLAVLCFVLLLTSTFLILPSSQIPHPLPDHYRLCRHRPCHYGGGNKRNSHPSRKYSVEMCVVVDLKPTSNPTVSMDFAEISPKSKSELEWREPETQMGEEELHGSYDNSVYDSTSITQNMSTHQGGDEKDTPPGAQNSMTEPSSGDVDINPPEVQGSSSASHRQRTSAAKNESQSPHEESSKLDDRIAAPKITEAADSIELEISLQGVTNEAKDSSTQGKEEMLSELHTGDTDRDILQLAMVTQTKETQSSWTREEQLQDVTETPLTQQREVDRTNKEWRSREERRTVSSNNDPPHTENTLRAVTQKQKTSITGKGGEKEPGKDRSQADVRPLPGESGEKTFRQVALSGLFLIDLMWLSIQRLRSWSFMGMFNPLLTRLVCGDKDLISHYSTVFAAVQFFGIVFAPISGRLIDRKMKDGVKYGDHRLERVQASILVFAVTCMMSVGLTVCSMVPVLPLQYLTFLLHILHRSFIYGTNFAFVAHAFPFDHYGKLTGILALSSAVSGLLQYPLFKLMQETFNGNPLVVNIILLVLTVLSCIHPIFIWRYLHEKRIPRCT